MNRHIALATVLFALPFGAYLGGDWLMAEISGRAYSRQLLAQIKPADQKPLHLRWIYDSDAVKRHWESLDDRAVRAERRFLQLDLVFPLLYGGVLAFCLMMAWDALGRRFVEPAYLVALVLVTVLADWTENLLLLRQLGNYTTGGSTMLQAGWIRVASFATFVKLLFFVGTSLALISLVGSMLAQSWKDA